MLSSEVGGKRAWVRWSEKRKAGRRCERSGRKLVRAECAGWAAPCAQNGHSGCEEWNDGDEGGERGEEDREQSPLSKKEVVVINNVDDEGEEEVRGDIKVKGEDNFGSAVDD